ncbi:MAG: SMI1/KNR4 family protein [Candidatus Acidiferrales bacterium]
MGKLDKLTDQRVDAFVAAVNSSSREILFLEEIPEQCRRSESDLSEMFDWQIVRASDASWLPKLESELPIPLPPTLRSLVARYLFPSFEAGPLTLYSVGCERNLYSTEFRVAMTGDAIMWPFLLERGFLPFANPAGGSYDPVCFDFRDSSRKREPPVVRIDHEEILCYDRLKVLETVASGLDVILDEVTRQLRSRAAKTPSA